MAAHGPATREGTLVKLGNYEIANRLSYLLWGSMPDAALFASAAAGELGDLGGVETHLGRMLKDPKAADTFADFFTDWLDLDIRCRTRDRPGEPPSVTRGRHGAGRRYRHAGCSYHPT